MKKIITLVSVFVFGVSALSAQNYSSSVGLRLGTSIGASYKTYMSTERAFEGILDLDIFEDNVMKLNLTGIYQFVFDTDITGLNFYAGPGLSAGVYLGDENGVLLAINGMAGVEYKIKNSPVSLSLDWNPKVQIITNAGFKPSNFGLTVRYSIR